MKPPRLPGPGVSGSGPRPVSYTHLDVYKRQIIAGGINFIELTMTMDDGDPVGFIKLMAEKYKNNDKVVIGAGTVLDPETARACILAGANYIVSPALNLDTVKLCNRYSCLLYTSNSFSQWPLTMPQMRPRMPWRRKGRL